MNLERLAQTNVRRLGAQTTTIDVVDSRLLLEDAEPFEALMSRCADIAARANRAGA
jgi:hypothetical protein